MSIVFVLMQHAHINIPGLQPLRIGLIGVEVFFVLSGFLIGGILLKSFETHQGDAGMLKEFWIRRWLRTLPLYYLVLVFRYFFIAPEVGSNLVYYFFFLQNNFYGISFMDVSWSLVIEEWFYLLAPVPLLLVFRRGGMDGLKKAIPLMIAVILLLRATMVYRYNTPYEGLNGLVPVRMDALLIGVLLSLLRRDGGVWSKLASAKFAFGGLLLLLAYLVYYHSVSSGPMNGVNDHFALRAFGFTVLPLTIGCLLPWFSELKVEKRFGLQQLVHRTALYTYALYLIHPMCFDVLHGWNLSDKPLLLFLAGSTFSYAVAALVYHLIEAPILRWRDRMVPASYSRVV
ncbi:MAG: hypothetical protein RL226_1234 [Bacteroidota bacterium]